MSKRIYFGYKKGVCQSMLNLRQLTTWHETHNSLTNQFRGVHGGNSKRLAYVVKVDLCTCKLSSDQVPIVRSFHERADQFTIFTLRNRLASSVRTTTHTNTGTRVEVGMHACSCRHISSFNCPSPIRWKKNT